MLTGDLIAEAGPATTVDAVTEDIDLIYDRLIAEEKLKSGTKYERLAAIAFRILTDCATVHDLRLRVESGVKHQIDAVVGDEQKRVLIECKDYDRSVDLPIVRDFWGVVDDVKPDEAFIVTTVGFSANAEQYAKAKGIRLALLREPQNEDWEGLIRRVSIHLTATGQTAPANVQWELHPDDHDKLDIASAANGLTRTADLKLGNAAGQLREFLPIFEQQLAEEYGKVPLGGEATIGRASAFDDPTWLHAPGIQPVRVKAWKWEVRVASETPTIDAAAELAAELILRTLDGSIRQMFTKEQIQAWTFDGHRVVPRE